jgi:hypothetical protein
VLRWHRRLVAGKWRQPRPPGRRRISAEITALIVRLATQNRTWGVVRIHGRVASTRASRGGVHHPPDTAQPPDPATLWPGDAWRTFLRAQTDGLLAVDCGVGLRAPNDDPTVIPVPTTPDRIKRTQRLGGLLNEHQPAA